jgi:hypothetical protein
VGYNRLTVRRNLIGSVVLGALFLVLCRLLPQALHAMERAQADPLKGVQSQAGSQDEPRARARANTPAQPALRVLFVGNSHTFYNDMPRTILQLAAAANEARTLEAVLEVSGGATLAGHLADRRVQEHLRTGRWDYVVLQEQQQRPTVAQPYLESEFFAPARTLDVLIRAAAARTVLYMTPARLDGDRPRLPNDTFEAMQERSRQNHLHLGRELGAIVAPVGSAWARLHGQYPEQPLWAADRYHPSPHGSYLTACVLYGVLYGHNALDNPYTAGLPAGDAELLQRAADAARSED